VTAELFRYRQIAWDLHEVGYDLDGRRSVAVATSRAGAHELALQAFDVELPATPPLLEVLGAGRNQPRTGTRPLWSRRAA
jgi:hypothetical protein